MIRFSNPIFISGHTRSGTNLLMRLIDGASGILVPPGEGKLNVLRRFLSLPYPIEGSPADLADTITAHIELHLKEAEQARFRTLVEAELASRPGAYGFLDVIVIILGAVSRFTTLAAEGPVDPQARWMEKNHNLEFFWHRARFLFGRPKLLFMLRNPFDNWLSWRQYMAVHDLESSVAHFTGMMRQHDANELAEAAFGGGLVPDPRQLTTDGMPATEVPPGFDVRGVKGVDTPEGRFALNYRRMYEKARALAEAAPEDVRIVRYEDVVLSTADTMRGVMEFLGCPFHDINVTPTDHGRTWGGNSVFRTEGRGGVERSSVGRGLASLTQGEIEGLRAVLREVPGIDADAPARVS